MLKGWVTVFTVLLLMLGGSLFIKSASAFCGDEFMNVSICGYIPKIVAPRV